jgi:ERCC4-type nuclease
MILVSPAERDPRLLALGQVSAVPEKWGADYLLLPARVGIQRKELRDFIASVTDGRLGMEVEQLRRCTRSVLILEGHGTWSVDGALMDGWARFTRKQLMNLLASIQERGVWVLQTRDIPDTAATITALEGWAGKGKHLALSRRPKVQSEWGKASSEEWMSWMLQAIPGLGPERAATLVKKYPNCVRWTVSEEEIRELPGFGKKLARQVWEALDGEHV